MSRHTINLEIDEETYNFYSDHKIDIKDYTEKFLTFLTLDHDEVKKKPVKTEPAFKCFKCEKGFEEKDLLKIKPGLICDKCYSGATFKERMGWN